LRELSYFVASSLDGFIANSDGGHDGFCVDGPYIAELSAEYPETFPTHFHEVLGISSEGSHFDTVLMGRATYEVGLAENITSPYRHLQQYVFSNSLTESPSSDINLVSDNIREFVLSLKQQEGKGIWLCGGGVLASELLAHQLIDRVLVKLNPIVMGSGIPLFSERTPLNALQYVDSRAFPSGVCLINYNVVYD
jgi:dihydrofolate reductase